jgi:type IV pilus assembly protein PilC
MPTFTYSARPATGGDIRTGEVEFTSKEEVASYLHRQKLIPVAIREKEKQISFTLGIRGEDPGHRHLHPAVRHDDQRGAAPGAVPRDPGRADRQRAAPQDDQEVLYDVESGNTLADSLGKHPKVFTRLYVNMVAAGEAGGILDTILLRLATFLEKNDALARKIKGAMIYPVVILRWRCRRWRSCSSS